MPPAAGRMDRPIRIERATETIGTIGQVTKTWNTMISGHAQKIPVQGSEVLKFSREVTSQVARFVTRWFSDLRPTDRIVETADSRTWDILYIEEIGRREGYSILAQVVQ